ncbi:MAG: fibronectin type III domain-containing protein [Methanomassiliicoccales archaeon]|nr:fibronectin type III domain-containing protein [Methanomassiliicoccales archaeon]
MEDRKVTRVISVMLLLMLLSGSFLVIAGDTVYAAQEGDYTYTIDEGMATITGYTGTGNNITIPDMLGGCPVVTIGNNSFSGHDSLTSVTISGNVTTIGEGAFSACPNIVSVFIPSSVNTIGMGAFLYCYAMDSIDVDAANQNFTSVDGVLYNKNVTILIQFPGGKAGEMVIPESVTSVGSRAFNTCPFLIGITISCNVTTIEEYAIVQCASLRWIDVNASNPSFASALGMLYDKNLTTLIQCPGGASGELEIPESTSAIGNWAFAYCPSLTSVTVPGNVTTIGFGAFHSCTSLTTITFLGLVAPVLVGDLWIAETDPELRGHAYAASNFPMPGETFYGLEMGEVVPIVPSAPLAVFAVPYDGHTLLMWGPPISDAGYAIANYSIYRSVADTSNYSLIAIVPCYVYVYNDTNLTKGEMYWYKLAANNVNGEGVHSVGVSVTIPLDDEATSVNPIVIYVAVVAIIAILTLILLMMYKRKNTN